MDIELQDINKFLHDGAKDNLVVYEVEYNQIDDPNEKLRVRAKAEGQCACRLWLILFLTNFAIIIMIMTLVFLLLIEVGPVSPHQNYGEQCVSGKCDTTKGLVCSANGGLKTCRCPSGNWFWFNNRKCRECPPNWVISNSGTSCSFISYIRLNFTDASQWCRENQGHLMEILNKNIFLALQSIKQLSFTLNNFYWIGLREIGANKNIYRWITSQSIFSQSDYFCSGQPTHSYNYYFQQYDQCIGLYIQSNTSSCLRDSTCPNVQSFICELN